MEYVSGVVIVNSEQLSIAEYEYCTFRNIDLSNTDLSNYMFANCIFENCNLSLVKMNNTGLQGVTFIECKLLGLQFDNSNQFALKLMFDRCYLDYSSFFGMKMIKTKFLNSQFKESIFIETNLEESEFTNCNLEGAIFQKANLEKVDFTTSYNFSISPDVNRISKARFSLSTIRGLLDQYNIVIEDI